MHFRKIYIAIADGHEGLQPRIDGPVQGHGRKVRNAIEDGCCDNDARPRARTRLESIIRGGQSGYRERSLTRSRLPSGSVCDLSALLLRPPEPADQATPSPSQR